MGISTPPDFEMAPAPAGADIWSDAENPATMAGDFCGASMGIDGAAYAPDGLPGLEGPERDAILGSVADRTNLDALGSFSDGGGDSCWSDSSNVPGADYALLEDALAQGESGMSPGLHGGYTWNFTENHVRPPSSSSFLLFEPCWSKPKNICGPSCMVH
jgi:hypothetical protein